MTKPSGKHQAVTPAQKMQFLAEADRLTLGAMFTNPLPPIGWHKAVALFDILGTVEPQADDDYAFRIGAEHHVVHKPRDADLSASEVVDLRHLVERAGLAPTLPASHAYPAPRPLPAVPGLLVAMNHHGARVFQIDAISADPAVHTIKPYDPHGYLHHLTHKDEPREHGQRAAEDPAYYERIAQTVMAGAHIVEVGHGHGHSDAAHHMIEYLQTHHREFYGRTVTEVVADLSSLTEPQLLDLGRRALREQAAQPSACGQAAPHGNLRGGPA